MLKIYFVETEGEIKFAGKYTEIKVYVDNYSYRYSGDSRNTGSAFI